MLSQTFALSDLFRVALLAFLEVLLSADNAIVLAVLTKELPQRLRAKALYVGFASAFILRAIGILSISFLLDFFWFQLIGALYLLYLSLRHFLKKRDGSFTPKPIPSFWKTVLVIEFFDLAFAIDSIVAGVAFIGSSPTEVPLHSKLWIVYLGGMIGALAIRYAAHFFTTLMGKFPKLEHAAYAMIAWIGLKLALTSLSLTFPYFEPLFWTGLILLFLCGFSKRKSNE